MRRAMIITTDFGFVRVRFVEIFVIHTYIYIYIIGPTVADKSSGYAGITAFYD